MGDVRTSCVERTVGLLVEIGGGDMDIAMTWCGPLNILAAQDQPDAHHLPGKIEHAEGEQRRHKVACPVDVED